MNQCKYDKLLMLKHYYGHITSYIGLERYVAQKLDFKCWFVKTAYLKVFVITSTPCIVVRQY